MLFPWDWFGNKVTFTACCSSNLLICLLFCFFTRNQGAQNSWSWKMITRSFGGLNFPFKYHYLGISFGKLNGVSVILTYLNESLIGKISTRVSFFSRIKISASISASQRATRHEGYDHGHGIQSRLKELWILHRNERRRISVVLWHILD